MNENDLGDFDKKLKKITDHFGITTQLIKLNEEMGELLNEGYYAAYNKEYDNKNSLEDEAADVLNVFLQIILYFGLDWDKIQGRMEYKVDRCLDRINGNYYDTHTR